ncbi:hypothetical protein SDC9_111385 [bioreactor metagenome]|uniref:Uncharacterized protein n=1 Tax=bioreactor metagenome TaxID=1076179 RepID=A0A645BHB3_9ZZZZ
MIAFNCVSAVAQDLVHSLHDGIRRQSSVFAGQAHAPARTHHAHPQRFRRGELRREKVSRAVGKDIMVVETRRAAIFHQLAHAAERAQANGVLVEVCPDVIERGEPVEQL